MTLGLAWWFMARRKKRKLDGHYQVDNVVSVWLGTFPDQTAFERYFAEDWEHCDSDGFPACLFWKDLGIRWFDHDSQEGGFVGDPIPVEELFSQGWSYLVSFRDPLLEACRLNDVKLANAIMLLYDYDYPQEAGYTSPNMKFLDVFPYAKDDS
jgi:hypothetical protein